MAVLDATRWLTSPPRQDALTGEQPAGLRSQLLLWAALSMSLLVFVPGAYLVPALTLGDAISVAIVGGVAGAAMLGGVAAVAAKRHRNTVGLLGTTLGVPAGPAIAALLLVRHLVWAAFTLAFAANVAAHVPGLGGARALCGVAFGALALGLALVPARLFVERWVGWFTVWVGIVLVALVTLTGATTYGIPMLHDADGLGGWPTRAQGFDLIAAMPLLWLPVVADYAYTARSSRDAGIGAFAGSGVMTAWYAVVGVLWVFTVSAGDVAGFMSALPIGAGAILIVIALQANAVAANIYAASMAGGRFGYRWFRPALIATGVAAGALVVLTDALEVEDAALLLAAVFVPLFAIVLTRDVIPGVPAAAWAAWALGILAFGWINPGDYAPWRSAMEFIFGTVLRAPFPLGGELTPIPATVASCAAAAAAYVALSWLLARRGRV